MLWNFSRLIPLYGAGVLPDRRILISDTGNDRVIIIDRSGDIVWEFRISS